MKTARYRLCILVLLLFAVAGREEAGGDILVKAINTGQEPVTATLNLRGVDIIKPDATVTVLTSGNLSDNNNLDEPMRVVPKETRLSNAASEFDHEFPAHSFSLLRLKTRYNKQYMMAGIVVYSILFTVQCDMLLTKEF